MVFLERFNLLSESSEHAVLSIKKNIHNTMYPLHIFPRKELETIYFEPITIFYGNNGSGKTTLLNIISNKLGASKKNVHKLGEIFDKYVERTDYNTSHMSECANVKFISSDDVFDYLLDIRAINSGVNRRKEEISKEYLNALLEEDNYSIFDYEKIKNKYDSRNMTHSKYIRTRLTNNNYIEHSNGESALEFWEKEIEENGIYLLDEPENSLSSENQIKLKQFLEDSARFYNCQFIISTHSPFLLSLEGAKIYDLDSIPSIPKKWTELRNVRLYYDFFKNHSNEFH